MGWMAYQDHQEREDLMVFQALPEEMEARVGRHADLKYAWVELCKILENQNESVCFVEFILVQS